MSRSSGAFYELLDQLIADQDELFVPEVRKVPTRADDQSRLFLEIVTFRKKHGRTPNASSRSPEEMRLGVRLAAFQKDPHKVTALRDLDQHGLLKDEPRNEIPASLDELIASGDDLLATPDDHIFEFNATPAPKAKAEADIIAERVPCKEFNTFAAIFDEVIADIAAGARSTVPTSSTYQIAVGDIFILEGQLAYIADVGPWMTRTKGDQKDARLRIIYDNGTESGHLLRSFGKALYRADNSRRVLAPQAGPLFSGQEAEVTGCIYVVRTMSQDPALADLKHHILKIGSTVGTASERIAGAATDPTFLLAPAAVVAEYETKGVPPKKIESLLHRFFAGACLNVRLPDRFGKSVDPREWFMVSPEAIERAVRLIATGKLHIYNYNVGEDSIVERSPSPVTYSRS